MKRIEDIPKTFDPSTEEKAIYQQWLDAGAFHAEAPSDRPPFCIVMPPPNVTGALHMGHAIDNMLPDALVRYHRLIGDNALFLPGTDHASIATESVVVARMREEGLSKEDVGRERFLERAWAWKEQYEDRIVHQQQRLGLSCDWDRHRFTMDEGLSRAVTKVFVKMYEEGLIYRGERMINWCPSCVTSISDIEVEHEDVEGAFYTIFYPFEDGEGGVEIATTRPETMLGDTAVAVHPDDAKRTVHVGRRLRLPLTDRVIPIIADEHVDPEFGTGFVKITPAHDPNDYEIGLRHDLPAIDILTDDGKLNDTCGAYAGMTVAEARKAVVEALDRQGLLRKTEPITHMVGTCQRCHSIVEPKISLQWFVRMEPLAKPAIEAVRNGDTKFVPDHFKKTYFNWLENIRDWCISRQLWWGHRIPAWYCDDCDEVIVAATEPTVCPACGGTHLTQDEDTLDTWFSSALWPFTTLGWPDETDDYKTFYPTDVLITGYDIIFFWVARMIFSALHNTGQTPFHTVMIHGLVLDPNGRKMSKSLGNGIDPIEKIDQYGADALRFALMVGNALGNDMRWRDDRFENGRNFVNKIWNAYRFIAMNLDPNVDTYEIDPDATAVEDRWIMSELKYVIEEVTRNIEQYELGLAFEKVHAFIWDLFCDWYIELVKERLRAGGATARAAQAVLFRVFSDTLIMLSPFMPFVTERIYGDLHDGEMVITSHWPDADGYDVDEEAMETTRNVIDAVRGIRSLRAEYKIEPSRRFSATLKTRDEDLADRLIAAVPTLERLAGISDLKRARGDQPFSKDDVVVTFLGGELAIPLRELIDIDAERERLTKDIDMLRREIKRAEGMLNNRQFVEKAPAHVVEQQREKKADYEARLAQSTAAMERLDTLA
ncbi:MAG: valine--tRNA ligase [Saccharofermentanales bacterium]